MKQHREALDRFTERVAELDAVIAELSAEDQAAQLLMRTPGLIQFSAVALSSRLGGSGLL